MHVHVNFLLCVSYCFAFDLTKDTDDDLRNHKRKEPINTQMSGACGKVHEKTVSVSPALPRESAPLK